VIEDTEKLTGCAIARAFVDKGYRGHDVERMCPEIFALSIWAERRPVLA
jgi:hypothetical protein